MLRKPIRKIPRAAMFLVALLALGASMTLVSVAWRSSKGEIKPTPGASSPITNVASSQSFVGCTDCHKDLDKVFKAGKAPALTFTHAKHFSKGVSDCAMCHAANTHEADKINKPTMGRCFMCHGQTKTAMAPGACETCHPRDFPRKPTNHAAVTWVAQKHPAEAKEDPFECLTCHQQTFCTSCHGLTMPHPADWKEAQHQPTFFKVGMATCTRCHARSPTTRDSCDTCHHPDGPKNVAWRSAHPNTVKAKGATTCFGCHEPETCAKCHVRQQEDFSADKANLKTGTPSSASPSASPK